jgi:DNA-binding transcriptional MerR regulator
VVSVLDLAYFASSRQLADWTKRGVMTKPRPEPLLDLGAVCRATGLSARTVRYYEELGLLPGVRRKTGGRRVYGADELERLAFITRLKKLGLSLQEIGELNAVYSIGGSTAAMLARLEQLLAGHVREIDARIAELGHLRDEIAKYRDHIHARADALRAQEERR